MKIFENKIIKIIFAIFEWLLCAILVLLILLTGFQKFSNQGNFFGYRIYTIASGSMIPRYNIGDTLLIEEMPSSEIHEGDAVTYIAEKGGKDGMIITHEVIHINIDENGKYSFNTKGVANNIEDPIVYEEQVLGKVIHKFFFLSILGRITTNMVLTLIFVIVPIAFVAAIELFKAIKRDEDEDDEDDDEDDDDDENEGPEEDESLDNDSSEGNDSSEEKIEEPSEDEELKEPEENSEIEDSEDSEKEIVNENEK